MPRTEARGQGPGASAPSAPQRCLVFLSRGQECAGRGQPGRQRRTQQPLQPQSRSRVGLSPPSSPWPLLLSSKMFQYVELWGRDGKKNRDIVEKEIMNNPAASVHTPHMGRSG